MRKLLLALLVAVPYIANGESAMAPKVVDTSKIAGGTYVVESTHALIGWKVDHFGFNDYFGIFGNPTGTLKLDTADPAKSSVSIDIPISGLVTASDGLTGHMKTPDFFNAAVHPSAKFVSTMVKVDGTKAMIHGDLTILGVTKPVVLDAKLSGAGINFRSKKETVGFHATASIKRSEWGMGKYVPAVGDKVDLDISVAFEK